MRCSETRFYVGGTVVRITIIGILIALLLPACKRRGRRRGGCSAQQFEADRPCHAEFRIYLRPLPAAFTSGVGHATWLVLILPTWSSRPPSTARGTETHILRDSGIPSAAADSRLLVSSHRSPGPEFVSKSGDS